jgi:hypothetical protein
VGESEYLELIHEEIKSKISGSHSGVEKQLRENCLLPPDIELLLFLECTST